MMNRRRFLTTSAAFGATLVGLPRSVELIAGHAAADTVITILHTNDTHSQIDPLPANDATRGREASLVALHSSSEFERRIRTRCSSMRAT